MRRIEDSSENVGVEKTTVTVEKTKSYKGVSSFKGAVNTLEVFFTLKAMTLNIKIEQYLSKENNELIIIYRFS